MVLPEVLLPAAVELPVLRVVPLFCPVAEEDPLDCELTELLPLVPVLRLDCVLAYIASPSLLVSGRE